MKIEKSRSAALDAVRIFAAFWVLGFHWLTCPGCFYGFKEVPNMDWVSPIFYNFFEWGFLGVDIFFILSGSLIAKSAMDNKWSNFTRQRFIRLSPAYFLIGLLSLFLYPIATNSTLTVGKIFSLSGLQFWVGGPPVIAVGWTLRVEIAFYFLVAIALFIYNRKRNFGSIELRNFLNIWLVLHILFISIGFEPLNKLFITGYAPYFILGATLSLVKTRSDFFANIFTISVSMALTLKFVFYRVDAYPLLQYKFVSTVLLVIFMSGIIIYSNQLVEGSRTNFIAKSIQTISLMTYPIYLIHLEVGLTFVYIYLTLGLLPQFAFLAALLTILVISYAVVRFYEPFCKKIFNKYVLSKN
jgi:peptidoglycan/LPS O-acetylase OafA/YrhL